MAQKTLRLAQKANVVIGAICAAPTALHAAGIHLGSRITSYPSFEEELSQSYVFQRDQDVVTDAGDKLVTSRGPATAMPFAIELLRIIAGEAVAGAVRQQLLMSSP